MIEYDFGRERHIWYILDSHLAPSDPLRDTDFMNTLARQLKGPHTPDEFLAVWEHVAHSLSTVIGQYRKAKQPFDAEKFKRELLEVLCDNRRFIRAVYAADADILHMESRDFLRFALWNPVSRPIVIMVGINLVLAFSGATAQQIVGDAAIPIVGGLALLIFFFGYAYIMLSILCDVTALLITVAHDVIVVAVEAISEIWHLPSKFKARRRHATNNPL